MKIFLLRHGETYWNREGIFQGQTDTELNENGLRQSDLLAERFRGYPLEAVFTSPLSRASVLAQKICAASGCNKLVTEPAFMEIHHGDWQKRKVDEIQALYPTEWKMWHTVPAEVKMPGEGGESLSDVYDRSVAGLERTVASCSGEKDIAITSHDVPLKAIIFHCLGLPMSAFWRLNIPNCSVSFLETCENGLRLGLLGDVSHFGTGFESFVAKSL